MKVCVIGLRGIPGVSGGIETHCENLYNQMAHLESDHKIIVFGRKPYIGKTRYRTGAGVEVVPAFALKNKYLETLSNTFVSILRARFGERADCIHLHAIGPGLLAPLARFLGVPVVLTHHGDDFQRAKWNKFAKAVLRTGERLGLSSASQVIAVSPTLAERLRQDYPKSAKCIRYIPNGADHIIGHSLVGVGDAVLTRHALTAGEYIVSVGRLVPEKGFADLIKAHRASGTDRKLVIVGGQSNSNHDDEIKNLAHSGVILTGNLEKSEVAHLLSQAGLFVLASHHEGLPIAALEAWAMGAPLLLSDIQPNRDLGLPQENYFPVGDIEALAARLSDSSTQVEPIPLASEFDWASIAERTAEAYNELHGKNARSTPE
ncbi:MAG: glycosyltransferase family 4 protein [Yoonia sp.]|uniref:glycosyltransferase family 4 protein n=1 Tax=Yoonia sp. TaxID=2212373 RepID=UPI003EF917EC